MKSSIKKSLSPKLVLVRSKFMGPSWQRLILGGRLLDLVCHDGLAQRLYGPTEIKLGFIQKYPNFKFSFNFMPLLKTINKNTLFLVNNLFIMVYNFFFKTI